MADVLENAEADLTPRMRNLINGLWSEWKLIEQQLEELNDELERICAADYFGALFSAVVDWFRARLKA